MIALFYVMRLINGDTTYDRVPTLVKEDVNRILIEKGYEHLIEGDSK